MTLPASLSSSYQRYKEDQRVFTTWLYQTARSCGYKSESTVAAAAETVKKRAAEITTNPTQRLKGKARKLAKQSGKEPAPAEAASQPIKSVTYTMPAAELTGRVDAIAKSSKRRTLPSGIQMILRRVIAARKKCADWYAQSGADVVSNAGHRHFIDILQNALNTLSDGAESSGNGEATMTKLSNQFEVLHVEDLDEEYPMTAAEVSEPNQPAGSQREIYDLDEHDADFEFEVTFSLFCFFEDLHAIQAEIRKVWQRFDKGQVDLKTATIITQAGLDMVRRLEAQQASQRKSCEHRASKHPHVNLSLPVFYAEAMMAGEDPDEILSTPKQLEHRPFYDFIYLPTTRTLMKFADVAYQCKDKVMWPFPVVPMRFSYIVRPDLLELPGYKQREEDDRILTQLLLDVFLADDCKKMSKQSGMDDRGSLPILQDEFAKTAKTLWETGTVDTSAVFTSRLVLDILEICGGSSQPRFARLLREQGRSAESTMDFINDGVALDTREVRWLAKDSQLLMDIYSLVKVQIPDNAFPLLKNMYLAENTQRGKGGSIEDMPPEVQMAVRKRMIERGEDPDDGPTEEHKRNAEKLDLKPIDPSQQQDFLQTHNALHCGSYSLRLTIMLEEAGIALANHHLSIFATAHLYNALHQLGVTEIRWPEMDRILDLHVNALFANDVPKSPSECYRRMEYRTGFNLQSRTFNKKQPWKFRTGAASASLKQLLDNADVVEHALLQLEAQIDDHATTQVLPRAKKNVSGRRRQLKPAQLMARFEEYLPVVMKDMELNYITLTKTCNALMKAIRAALQENLGIMVPSIRTPGDSNDHSVIYVVLLVLDESRKSAAAHEKLKDGSKFEGGVELRIACRAFEDFFNAHIAPKLST